MLGGIIVNVVVGYLIYSLILNAYGKSTIYNKDLKHGIACDTLGIELGLKDGDKIVAIDGKKVVSYNEIVKDIILDKPKNIEVLRDGKTVLVPVFEDVIAKLIRNKNLFIKPRVLSIVDSTAKNTTAQAIGLMKGDRLISINDKQIVYYDQIEKTLKQYKKQAINIQYLRGKDTISKKAMISESGKLGFIPNIEDQIISTEEKFGLLAAFKEGIHQSYEMIAMQVKQLSILFTVKGAHKSIGGFYSMTKVFAPVWDWQSFWKLTAIISFGLAFMNLLPIPGLDGGHAFFLLFEMITGKQPSDKFLIAAQYVGLFIILGLMIYANTDWLREWLASK
jgi:regulator of sigma E protease